MTCIVCSALFTPRNVCQVTCGDKLCRQQRRKVQLAEYFSTKRAIQLRNARTARYKRRRYHVDPEYREAELERVTTQYRNRCRESFEMEAAKLFTDMEAMR